MRPMVRRISLPVHADDYTEETAEFWHKGVSLRVGHNRHYYLSLAPAIELAEENSLPAAEQELAVAEGDGDAWADEGGFDVRVGVFFAVAEAHAVLGDERAQVLEHVARHVGVGVLVDGETGGGVLREEDADACACAGLGEPRLHVGGELDQLFALA